VTIKGVCPLLHHKFNPPKQTRQRKSKKVYDPKTEAEKGLYKNSEGVIYQPAEHLEGAIIKAATNFQMKGRKTYRDYAKACLILLEREIPFTNGAKYEIDERPVIINRARVMAWRPRWSNWQFTFIIRNLQPDMMDDQTLKEILEHAGLFVGIGDFRPKFGRFEVTGFEPKQGKA